MLSFGADILAQYHPETRLDDDAFCQVVGQIQGEFLAIHPFREGNARTIKLVSDLIAAQGGRPVLRYDQTAEATERYVRAAAAALAKKDYVPMIETIREALRAAAAG